MQTHNDPVVERQSHKRRPPRPALSGQGKGSIADISDLGMLHAVAPENVRGVVGRSLPRRGRLAKAEAREGIAEAGLTPMMRVASRPPAIPSTKKELGKANMALQTIMYVSGNSSKHVSLALSALKAKFKLTGRRIP